MSIRKERGTPLPESGASTPRARKYRLGRLLIYSATALLASVAALYLLRGIFVEPVLRNYLTATARERLGPTLEIGDISGSYITGLEFRNVGTIEKGTKGPLISLAAERLSLRYSLFSLLGGLETFLGCLEVDLQGAGVEMLMAEEERQTGGAVPLGLPPTLPQVRIRDSALSVAGRGFGVDLSGIDLEVTGGKTPTRIDLGLAGLLITHPVLHERTFSLRTRLRYTAEALTVEELLLDDTPVAVGRISLEELPGAFSVEATATPLGGRFTLQGERREEVFTFSTDGENLDIGRAVSLFRLGEIAPGGSLTFQAAGRLAPPLPFGGEVELSLTLKDGSLKGREVEELRFEGSLRDAVLEVARLHGSAGKSTLSFLEGRLPLRRLADGEWRELLREAEAGAVLKSGDLPAFLALWGVDLAKKRAEVPPHELRLEGRLRGGTLDIRKGDLRIPGGGVTLNRAAVTFPAATQGWREMMLSVDGDVDLENAGLVAEILPLPPLGGSMRGHVRVDGALTALQGALEVEAGDFTVAGRPVGDITLTAEADRERVALMQGELRQEEGNVLSAEKLSLPAGALFAGDGIRILRSLRGGLSVRLEDVPHFLETLGVSRKRQVEIIPGHLLTLDARFGMGEITLASGKLETAQGLISLEEGHVVLPVEGEDLLVTEVDADLTVDLPDLRVVEEIFTGPPLDGALHGRARIRGPLRNLEGTLSSDITDLSYAGHILGNATLKAEMRKGRLILETLHVTNEDDMLNASGIMDFDGFDIENGEVDFHVGELADYTAELLSEKWRPRGSLQGRLALSGPLSSPHGDLEMSLREGGVGTISVAGIEANLTASEKTVVVKRLEVESDLGFFSLAEGTRIGYGRGRAVAVEDATIHGPAGTLRIEGSIGPEGALDFSIDAKDLNSDGWLEKLAGDRLSFSGGELALQVEGSFDRPHLTAKGKVAKLRGKGDRRPLTGAFDLAYDNGTLTVHAFSLEGEAGHLEGSGVVPVKDLEGETAEPMDLTLTLDIPHLKAFAMLFPEGYAPRGLLRGELRAEGSIEDPELQVSLETSDLFPPQRLQVFPSGPFSTVLKGSWRGDEMLLDLLRIDSEVLVLKATGSWKGGPSPGGILAGERQRLAGDVGVDAEFAVRDLSWTARAAERIRHVGGSVSGRVNAAGSLTDPEITASLDIRDAEVSLTGLPLLSSLNGGFRLGGRRLSLNDVSGEIGGSPARLEGSLTFGDGWEPAFDLHLAGERLLLYRDRGVRLRADTDLSLKGPLEKLEVAGVIGIADSHFVRNIDFLGSLGGQKRPPIAGKGLLFSFRDPPLRDLQFDLALETIDPFRIRNQFLKGSVRPDLVLKGTGESPFLVGEVSVDPSRLYIPAGILRTERGAISFLKNEPDRPRIDLKGSTRLMGYDISMSLAGFIDDPRITLSSLPPLPDDELLLLVMLGTPPPSGSTGATGTAGGALAVFLGRSFLNRFFEDGAETEGMILDRFETVFGRDITEKGEPTIDSTFRLEEGFFWKGDTLYLTAEKDRYDEINYGVRFTVEFEEKEEDDK